MSNLLKVVLGVIVVGAVVFVAGASLFKSDKELSLGLVSSINTPGTFVQDFVLTASSTDRATSSQIYVENADRLTCFLGTDVAQGGQVIYSAQVSSQAESAQTTDFHSTSTPLMVPSYGASGVTQMVTAESITASSTGTTTVSIDLERNIYPFFRI